MWVRGATSPGQPSPLQLHAPHPRAPGQSRNCLSLPIRDVERRSEDIRPSPAATGGRLKVYSPRSTRGHPFPFPAPPSTPLFSRVASLHPPLSPPNKEPWGEERPARMPPTPPPGRIGCPAARGWGSNWKRLLGPRSRPAAGGGQEAAAAAGEKGPRAG